MRKLLLSPILGLAIIASSLAVTAPANAAFKLRNMYLGTCLGIANANANPGGKLILWSCIDTPNQVFNAVPTGTINSNGEALFTLFNSVASNRVLGVAPVPQGAISAPVVTWTQDGSLNQQWTMTFVANDHQGNQCFAIRSNGTLTMLTPSGYNNSIGTVFHWRSVDYWGNLISESFGIPNGFGQAGKGEAVIASAYIWGGSLMKPPKDPWGNPWDPPLPFYRPDTYSVQYWCKV